MKNLLQNNLFETYRNSSLQSKIDEAIGFIQHIYAIIGEPLFVGFSGGKDSCVLLDLVRRSGVEYRVYYSCTFIDPPEITKFIKQYYPGVEWLFPKESFWKNIEKKGLPTIHHRWCCEYQKENPAANIPLKHRLFGIRADESAGRAARGRILVWGLPKKKSKTKRKIVRKLSPKIENHYHAIFNWKINDVWEYIHTFNVPYSELYDEDFKRIGCVTCPFLTPENVEKSRKKWPWLWKRIDNFIVWQWDKIQTRIKDGTQKKPMHMSLEEYMQWPNWPKRKDKEDELF